MVGFEPTITESNSAALPLGYTPIGVMDAPAGFEPAFTDPKSVVLPLDEGAIKNPPKGRGSWDTILLRSISVSHGIPKFVAAMRTLR